MRLARDGFATLLLQPKSRLCHLRISCRWRFWAPQSYNLALACSSLQCLQLRQSLPLLLKNAQALVICFTMASHTRLNSNKIWKTYEKLKYDNLSSTIANPASYQRLSLRACISQRQKTFTLCWPKLLIPQ